MNEEHESVVDVRRQKVSFIFGFALFVVAPLWLRRAKYEEELLVKTFGEKYKDYAAKLKWRRLVPKFFPIGV